MGPTSVKAEPDAPRETPRSRRALSDYMRPDPEIGSTAITREQYYKRP